MNYFLNKRYPSGTVLLTIAYEGQRISGTIPEEDYKHLCQAYAQSKDKVEALQNMYAAQIKYVQKQCAEAVTNLQQKLDALAGSNAAPVAKPIAVVAPVEPEPKIIKATPKLTGQSALFAVPADIKVEIDTSDVMSAADARKMFAKCLPTSADTTTPDAETNTIADQNAEELRSFA